MAPERTWDMVQFGLRIGTGPQVVATTTPRPVPLLKQLLADETTVVTRSATADNAANLAPTFMSEMMRRYAGTALGRQELLGELIEDEAASLWRRDWIERARVARAPELTSVVVAVDPPVTATASSDACGIVVAGIGPDDVPVRRGWAGARAQPGPARCARVGAHPPVQEHRYGAGGVMRG